MSAEEGGLVIKLDNSYSRVLFSAARNCTLACHLSALFLTSVHAEGDADYYYVSGETLRCIGQNFGPKDFEERSYIIIDADNCEARDVNVFLNDTVSELPNFSFAEQEVNVKRLDPVLIITLQDLSCINANWSTYQNEEAIMFYPDKCNFEILIWD